MVLAYPAWRPAGTAGIDQAGKVGARDLGHLGLQRSDVGPAGDQALPVVELGDIGRLAGVDFVDRNDVVTG